MIILKDTDFSKKLFNYYLTSADQKELLAENFT